MNMLPAVVCATNPSSAVFLDVGVRARALNLAQYCVWTSRNSYPISSWVHIYHSSYTSHGTLLIFSDRLPWVQGASNLYICFDGGVSVKMEDRDSQWAGKKAGGRNDVEGQHQTLPMVRWTSNSTTFLAL